MVESEGKISFNDLRVRILRVPRAIRDALAPNQDVLEVVAPGIEPQTLHIFSKRRTLSGVTELFNALNLRRRGPGGSWEARTATISWSYDPGAGTPAELRVASFDSEWTDLTRARESGQQELDDEVTQAWRESLERARESPSWQRSLDTFEAERRPACSAMRKLLADLDARAITLEEFRHQFDTHTRSAWVSFGFKGPSGAMFLNKLVKCTGADGTHIRLRFHPCAVLICLFLGQLVFFHQLSE